MQRKLVRFFLMITFMIAVGIIVFSIFQYKQDTDGAVTTIVASLAVIAAVVSGYGAQRVVELQEDNEQPYLYLIPDLYSRYGLVQIILKNYGRSPAFEIPIEWEEIPQRTSGEELSFYGGGNNIPILPPHERLAEALGVYHRVFEQESLTFSGSIKYRNASNKEHEQPFTLSFEPYRNSLVFDEETPKTHYELQKIPGELKKIRKELKELNKNR